MSLKKRLASICIAATCVFSASAAPVASAATDFESSVYGFTVDLDYHQAPYWYNSVTTKCYLSGR